VTGTEEPPLYAGFVTRAIALTIDVVIIDAVSLTVTAVIGLVLSAILPGNQSFDLPTALVAAATWLVFVAGYLVAFWVLMGATPGMRLMRIRVTAADGSRIGLGRGLRRLLGMVVAAIPLGAGFLLTLVDDRRQGLQDRLAGTFVVYASEPVLIEVAPPPTQLASARPSTSS